MKFGAETDHAKPDQESYGLLLYIPHLRRLPKPKNPYRFCLRQTLMGIAASGPVAGGVFATIQSVAMGGSALPIVAPVLGAAAVVVPTIAAALTMSEYSDAQTHTMGEVTGISPGHAYATVVHNWGIVELRSFQSMEAARESLHRGRKLRRFAARLFLSGEADVDNGHGWALPWVEDGHEGCRPDLDNEMRRTLLEAIGR